MTRVALLYMYSAVSRGAHIVAAALDRAISMCAALYRTAVAWERSAAMDDETGQGYVYSRTVPASLGTGATFRPSALFQCHGLAPARARACADVLIQHSVLASSAGKFMVRRDLNC